VAVARDAIGRALGRPTGPPPSPSWLKQKGASFVTLNLDGDLRGCIGSLEAHRPLGQDVRENAVAAAFHDPRFRPLSATEFERVQVEVSVLSAPEPVSFTSRTDALEQLRPGIDGVILRSGWHRATFLPQVWDQLPTPEEFVTHLMAKAGLPPDHWQDVEIQRYKVEAFHE